MKTPRPTPRGERPRHRRRGDGAWLRGLTIALAVGMLAIAAAVIFIPAELSVRFQGKRVASGDRSELLALVGDYKKAWNPADRAAIGERARGSATRLELAFHWLLSQPTHRLIEPCIDIAAEVGIESLREDLLRLAQKPRLRCRALLAADHIESLPADEVAALFGESEEAKIAALTMVGRRPARPMDLLLLGLEDDSAGVRAAALAALPEQLPVESLRDVLAIVADSRSEVATIGLAVLARAPWTGETEDALLLAATGSDAQLAKAALRALTQRPGALTAAGRESLWAIVDDTDDRQVRALAFLALEATGSATEADITERMTAFDAERRYYACRLLLNVGSQAGIDGLLDLLDETAASDEGDERQKELHFAAATLLTGLAKLSAASTDAELRAWFAAHPLQGPVRVPPPQLEP